MQCDNCGEIADVVFEFSRISAVHGYKQKFCYNCGLALGKIIKEGFQGVKE
jgi:hypothetical protein